MNVHLGKLIAVITIGLVLTILTLITHLQTNSFTMIAETFHSAGDFSTSVVLLIALLVNDKNRPEISKFAGWFLLLAGTFAILYPIPEIIEYCEGKHDGIHAVKTLSVASILTVILVSIQIYLAKDFHELLHGHHEHAKHAHKGLETELLADLFHALATLAVAVVAVFLTEHQDIVTIIDLIVPVSLGAWTFVRGAEILRDAHDRTHEQCNTHRNHSH